MMPMNIPKRNCSLPPIFGSSPASSVNRCLMRARTSVPHAGTESNCARIPTAITQRASGRGVDRSA